MVLSRESKVKDGGWSLSANDVINYKFKMARRLIKSVYKWKTEYLRQKAQHKLTSCSVFPLPLLFRRLSTVFFIDSETNETIPLHFWNVFHFFNEKKLFEKNFSPRMCAKRRSASCKKRREFWRETHTPLWLLIGGIIFLTCEKTSLAILIGRIIFFTCETIVHSS